MLKGAAFQGNFFDKPMFERLTYPGFVFCAQGSCILRKLVVGVVVVVSHYQTKQIRKALPQRRFSGQPLDRQDENTTATLTQQLPLRRRGLAEEGPQLTRQDSETREKGAHRDDERHRSLLAS